MLRRPPGAALFPDAPLFRCGSVGALTSYTFTNVTANHTIAASFAIDTYPLTTSLSSSRASTPSAAVRVNTGASQAFNITPDAGYHAAHLLLDGAFAPALPSY